MGLGERLMGELESVSERVHNGDALGASIRNFCVLRTFPHHSYPLLALDQVSSLICLFALPTH
jgi:hypothetical protein